jgi:tripartite-type tricarboxylate transporter receptor subunit TctC
MMLGRRTVLAGSLAAASALVLRAALAQSKFPERPIRLVIPFPPGGVNDTVGRPWAEKVRPHLGAVIIENVGGAGGVLGTTQVARAEPNGYTLLMGTGSAMVIAPLASTRKPYDPVKDFEPVGMMAVNSLAIAVNPSLPVRTLKELVEYDKANPGKLSYASAGVGTVNHLAGELFKSLAGLPDIVHGPDRGGGPAITDLVSGQVPVAWSIVTGQIMELHALGKLRVLAVAAERRLAAAPDFPTAAEAGVPGLIASGFIGLFAPAGTPAPIVEQVSKASALALTDPDMQRLIVASGFEPEAEPTPARTRRFLADELTRWTPVIRSIGLKLD